MTSYSSKSLGGAAVAAAAPSSSSSACARAGYIGYKKHCAPRLDTEGWKPIVQPLARRAS